MSRMTGIDDGARVRRDNGTAVAAPMAAAGRTAREGGAIADAAAPPPPATRRTADAGNVQSVARAAAILRVLAGHVGEGARLSEIAVSTGLHKATAHRLLAALKEQGLVDKSTDTHRYHLGLELFLLGSSASNRFSIRDIARASLQRLAEQTGDTVYLFVRSGMDALCVDRVEGHFPIRTLSLDIGGRRPLGVSSGSLALLAALGDDEVEQVLTANGERYARFGCRPDDVARMVSATRRDGHAISDGMVVPGMCAVAVAVRDRSGLPVAAITVGAISQRMDAARRTQIVAQMAAEARRIEQALQPLAPPQRKRRAARAT